MGLTVAQGNLLREMDNGWEVTFHGKNYKLTKGGKFGAKLWPSTFYGLYDNEWVYQLDSGNYTISSEGKEQI